jgi:hypothetical protein
MAEDNGIQRLRPLKIGWFHLGADIENSVSTRGLPSNSEQSLISFQDGLVPDGWHIRA